GRLRRHHHPLRQTGEDGEDGAADTAADDLADERAGIDVTGRARERRHYLGKKLYADNPADSPRNCVADRAERAVLERRSGGIAADDTSDNLYDEIDESSRHVSLPSGSSSSWLGSFPHARFGPVISSGGFAGVSRSRAMPR